IVHIHNTFPLISPSVLSIAGGRATAVVVTLHNYRLACPSAVYFRDGHICEDCAGHTFPGPGVLHGCYRNSRAASAVVGTTIGLHRALGSWTRNVDLFVAVS